MSGAETELAAILAKEAGERKPFPKNASIGKRFEDLRQEAEDLLTRSRGFPFNDNVEVLYGMNLVMIKLARLSWLLLMRKHQQDTA